MDDGFSQNYQTTYQFLEGLSKHYKMSAICDSADIPKCIPYSKINFITGEGADKTTESIDVSTLTSIDKFMTSEAAENYLAPAAFISAQGTPFIAAFKKGCIRDTEKAMISITEDSCFQIMYDKNGTGLPNKLGEDIVGMGLTIIPPAKGPAALATLGGVKIMTNAFVPDPLTASDCNTNKTTYGIADCRTSDDDYWGGAMKACKKDGYRLPTQVELAAMANALYIGMNASTTIVSDTYAGKDANNKYYRIGSNEPLPDALSGLGTSWYLLWSSSEDSTYSAYYRAFNDTYSRISLNGRYDYFVRAVCVAD